MMNCLNVCWIAIALLVSADCVSGDTTLNSTETVKNFVQSNCADCHAGDDAEAGFDVNDLVWELDRPGAMQRWTRIFDRVRDGEMPPPDANFSTEKEQQDFLNTTHSWLASHERHKWKNEGRVQGRRLTNLQLERTIHALLGIDIPLASRMPEEQKAHGFTTVADGQPMSHFQLEEHLKIVDLALDHAFERAIRGDESFHKEFDAKGISRKNPKRRTREPEVIDDLAVTWASRLIFYGRLPATTAREEGWYRFTFRAKSLNTPKNHGVWCTVRSGQCVSSAPLLSWIGAFEATDEIQEWTFDAWLPRGHMLEIRPGDDTLKMARFAGGQVGTGEGGPQNVAGVGIESLTMEKIHYGPDADRIASILFGNLNVQSKGRNWRDAEIKSKSPNQDLKRLMGRFAHRAFRRPVAEAEVASYIELAQQGLAHGMTLLDSLRLGYRAILCSPRFLYFQEMPGELDSYAIASRLSYFLWNTMPDEELRNLAEEGQLSDVSMIRQQVRRMLNDPRGENFVTDFAAQWLDLSDITFTTPDRRLYPAFDVIVQQSMVEETETFLQDMLDHNLSVTRLIDADETFLNERLARFYEIDGVSGDQLTKVKLDRDDHRGGLLTHGSILKVTANGTNTSPVIRGVWISERLLGKEIPPPPSNVPAIEPDIRGAKTIREMLEKHKSDASCASCHRSIDPPGFALENFDPAGQWREKYNKVEGRRVRPGATIDASYELPDGEKFAGLEEFQQLICRHPEQLAENVVEKLLTYGTGSPISFADRDDVVDIAAKTQKNAYGFRSLIEEVAVSELFRVK